MDGEKREHTILNIALLDLLQHLRPHTRMHLLVLLHKLRLQLHDLCEAFSLVLEAVGWC